MKKIVASSAIILSFISYAILHNKTDELPETPVSIPQNSTNQTSSLTTQSGTGQYRDGEYTGNAADAFYGNIQVKATIAGGKLTDVIFLQYPNDHHESIEINSQAMPILREEAIQAQSANVDTVTRATDTSMAFVQSLTSALNQAKN